MPDSTEVTRIASAIASPRAADAFDELARTPSHVSDAVAALLAREFLVGASAGRVCTALAELRRPVFRPRAHNRIVKALTRLSGNSTNASRTLTHVLTIGPRFDGGGSSLLARIASVFTRAWVLAVLGPALVLAIPVFIGNPGWALAGGLVIFGVAVLTVLIDASLRRCRGCKKLLAGTTVGIRHAGSYTEQVHAETPSGTETLNRTTNDYKHRWRCVHCDHTWER